MANRGSGQGTGEVRGLLPYCVMWISLFGCPTKKCFWGTRRSVAAYKNRRHHHPICQCAVCDGEGVGVFDGRCACIGRWAASKNSQCS